MSYIRYLPIYFDLKDKRVLIIGGGAPAEAKLRTLLKTEARLTVVAPYVSDEIAHWRDQARLEHIARDFKDDDLKGITLLYAATDDPVQNAKLAALARTHNIPTNAADQKDACDFITPALVERSPVSIAIGTEGCAPGLARAIKNDLESRLPKHLGAYARSVNALRKSVASKFPSLSDRQHFWAGIFGGTELWQRLRWPVEALTQRVEAELSQEDVQKGGHVSLVGAGPGNPDLLTFCARSALHSADVIIYDRLVSDAVLDIGRREAEYIYVGKTPGKPSIKQEAINEIITQHGLKGRRVVRLKSGDPLVFGRADEEIAALIKAGISYDIVPGITAAAAAAAEIGTSLTRRGRNQAISLLTGHDAKGFADHDWKTLATDGARAAVYMGVGAARFIQGRLLLFGASPKRTITIVENASRPTQKIIKTSLENLPRDIEAYDIKGPAILLIGYRPNHDADHKEEGKGYVRVRQETGS